jgi:hypothetical protein
MYLAADPDSNRLPATAKHHGDLVKPTTKTPPDRGVGTFRAARRQLGRALAGPLEALGERLRGTAASDASGAAARSKYRLQQVLNNDRSFPIREPSPPPIPAGVFGEIPAGVFGGPVQVPPIANAHIETAVVAAPEARPTPAVAGSSVTPSSLPPPRPAAPAVPPLRPAAPAILAPKPAASTVAAPAPATPALAAPQPAAPTVATPRSPAPASLPSPTSAPSIPPTPLAAPMQRAPEAPQAPTDVASAADEPIRTRSMARLLASQGHPARALAIYDWLLASNGTDDSLRVEAEALRNTARA